MKIKCPDCGQHYDIKLDMLGQHVKCEKCGNNFVLEDNLWETQIQLPPTLFPCPACFKAVSRSAYTCPHCGAPLRKDAQKTDKEIQKDAQKTNKDIQKVEVVHGLSILNIITFFICALLCGAALLEFAKQSENILQQIYHALTAIFEVLLAVVIATLLREH